MTTAMSSRCAPHRATRPSGAPSAAPNPFSFPFPPLSPSPLSFPLLRPSAHYKYNHILSYITAQCISVAQRVSQRAGRSHRTHTIYPALSARAHLLSSLRCVRRGCPTPLHPTGRGVFIPISSRPTAFFPLSPVPLSPVPSSVLSSPVTVIYYSPLLIHMAYKTAPRLGWCVGCNSYFVINGDMTCPRCNTPTVTARCTRCGHTWVPSRLAPGVPKYCTKCHSPYYDRTPVRNNSKVRRGSA